MNDTVLKRVSTVKYLGLFIDDTLKWSWHISHLSLQLARLAGLFYRRRNFVNQKTLSMLYYNLVYGRMQYGVILWGTANIKNLNVMKVIQNKFLRALLFSDIFTPLSTLYKSLKFLNVDGICRIG